VDRGVQDETVPAPAHATLTEPTKFRSRNVQMYARLRLKIGPKYPKSHP
jgi:hypothetical protein